MKRARRLEGTGVIATALHPGVVRTSFGAEDQAAHFAVLIRMARPFMKTAAQGAVTPVYLASYPPSGSATTSSAGCGPTWTGCTAPGSPTGPCGPPT